MEIVTVLASDDPPEERMMFPLTPSSATAPALEELSPIAMSPFKVRSPVTSISTPSPPLPKPSPIVVSPSVAAAAVKSK